jgi:hypothetical protein
VQEVHALTTCRTRVHAATLRARLEAAVAESVPFVNLEHVSGDERNAADIISYQLIYAYHCTTAAHVTRTQLIKPVIKCARSQRRVQRL